MIVIPSSRGTTASSILNPASISGLVNWMDASYGVSFVGPTKQVNEWVCKVSGLGFIPDLVSDDITWIQNDSYFNNQPSINFSTNVNSGVVGLYNEDLIATIATIFVVYNMLSSNGFEYQVLYENDGLNLYTERTYTDRYFGSYVNQFADADTVSTLSASYIRAAYSADGTDIFFEVNGIADGNPGGNGFYTGRTQVVIGNGGARPGFSQPFTGRIAEILAYDTFLTSAEILKVTGYLNAKYRLF